MNQSHGPSSNKYKSGQPGRTVSALLAAFVCMASTVAAAKTHSGDAPRKTAGAPGQAAKQYKLDTELTRRSNDRSHGPSLTRVIVTLVPGAQLPEEFKKYSLNTRLDLIDGEVLDLPNQVLASMARTRRYSACTTTGRSRAQLPRRHNRRARCRSRSIHRRRHGVAIIGRASLRGMAT
jgi:hypothetical protein